MNFATVDNSTTFTTTKAGQKCEYQFLHNIPFHATTKTGQRIAKENVLSSATSDWLMNPAEDITPHYHVFEFIDGCLNDYDSGPYESLEDARKELAQFVEESEEEDEYGTIYGMPYTPAGIDRFVRGVHILKIEECNEAECLEEGAY